ncbi:MAG: hypothetical protein WBE86_14900 [Candidatus Acidiferrales bacterium]
MCPDRRPVGISNAGQPVPDDLCSEPLVLAFQDPIKAVMRNTYEVGPEISDRSSQQHISQLCETGLHGLYLDVIIDA